MPGLIDMHVHLAFCGKAALTELTEPPELVALKALNNAQEDLMGGFTTVRDAGFSSLRGAQAVRDAISSGIVWWPRVFTSGMYIHRPEVILQQLTHRKVLDNRFLNRLIQRIVRMRYALPAE